MIREALAAATLCLSAAPLALAQVSGPQTEHLAFATLDNGTWLGFALLRAGAPSDAAAIGKAVFPRSNGVSRVLVDEASASFFGYRLEVDPVDKGQSFRLAVKPLAPGIEKELQRSSTCPQCPPPSPLAQPLRFPAPQSVADGDVFLLELLVNPATGEKIADAVKVSRRPIPAEAMQAAAARLAESLLAVQRGDTLAARRLPGAAIPEYQKALAIHPNDAVVRNKLGICYQKTQRLQDAEKQYQRSLAINPNYAEAWNNLGSLEHGRGRFRQAIKHYQKAIKVKPGFATAYKNLGSAFFALGRFDAGYEAYLTAYRLDPTILEAPGGMAVSGAGVSAAMQSFYFAKISAANGQIDTALALLRKAFEAGFKEFDRIAHDPDLEVVVSDPRYHQLLQEFGFR